jgi:hypothetical protein
LALLLSAALPAPGQNIFRDLGFESASLVPVGNPEVQFAPAFPGWTCSIAGVEQTFALYDTIALDSSAISIIDSGWPYPSFGGVIQGNYTAIVQAGLYGMTPANTTLSQTGPVPIIAQSLLFKAYYTGSLSPAPIPLVVTLGGQQLSYTPVGSGTNYTLYGADIHTLAGQTAELDFTVLAQNPHVANTYIFLDSIQFSDLPVPEPGVFGLSALGALLLGWRVLGRRR